MFSLFFIAAICADSDDDLGPARDLLTGTWNAEISRTDSKGRKDEKENELVEVRFNYASKRKGTMKMGVYLDSAAKEPIYEADITWESNGVSASVDSSSFSTNLEFYLLTKYEARGTANNYRYLFEITSKTEAQATFTDVETNEITTVKLYRDPSYFDGDWKPTIYIFGVFAILLVVALTCTSPEAKAREAERLKKMEETREAERKARKEKMHQQEARAGDFNAYDI